MGKRKGTGCRGKYAAPIAIAVLGLAVLSIESAFQQKNKAKKIAGENTGATNRKHNKAAQTCGITNDEYEALLVERKPEASDVRRLKARKTVDAILFIICLASFCFSAAMLYMEIAEYKAGSDAYADFRNASVKQQGDYGEDDSIYAPSETSNNKSILEETWPSVDFAALSAVNPDIAAWIISDDGTIDYPIVYGNDNTYYLEHLFDGTKNKAGCLFIDSENAPYFSDCNTIIYGHNMKDGSMFGGLEKYREQTYYDANPRMRLMTPSGNYILELFAGYVTGGDGDSWRLEFSDGNEFELWAENAKSKSAFESNAVVTKEDRTVTLSTCAYDFEGAYFVLKGVLIPYESR